MILSVFCLIFSPLWYFAFNFFKIIEVDGFHINSEKINLNKLKCFLVIFTCLINNYGYFPGKILKKKRL